MTAAGIVDSIVGFITAIGVIFSIFWAIRTGRQDTRNSQAAADRAEAAARLQDEQVNRLVDAIDSIQLRTGVAAPVERQVRWSMISSGGDGYLLRNESDSLTATDIVLGHAPSLSLRQPDRSECGPGEAVTFVATRSTTTRDSTVTVSWRDGDGPARQWRYPLPPPT